MCPGARLMINAPGRGTGPLALPGAGRRGRGSLSFSAIGESDQARVFTTLVLPFAAEAVARLSHSPSGNRLKNLAT
jgi:hypothetical protein